MIEGGPEIKKEIQIKENKVNYYKFEVVIGEKVVGRAFLYLIYNDLHPQPYGLLEDVFVEEAYRGKGIGKELVQQVIEKAKELGCYKLIATSRFGRENVHQLYESLGFEKWGYEFRMDFE